VSHLGELHSILCVEPRPRQPLGAMCWTDHLPAPFQRANTFAVIVFRRALKRVQYSLQLIPRAAHQGCGVGGQGGNQACRTSLITKDAVRLGVFRYQGRAHTSCFATQSLSSTAPWMPGRLPGNERCVVAATCWATWSHACVRILCYFLSECPSMLLRCGYAGVESKVHELGKPTKLPKDQWVSVCISVDSALDCGLQ
jgi:hypothetical protein